MKHIITLLFCSFLIWNCSSGGGGNYSPGQARLKIERPGRGAALEEELAKMLLAKKYEKALKTCNDVLFSSRSNQDRETANYWRTIIMAKEEIDAGNYESASLILKKGSKWWKNKAKDYHVKLVSGLLAELQEKDRANLALLEKINRLNRTLKHEKNDQLKQDQLELENQKLLEEIVRLKVENRKMEKLLIELK